jgi:hypothetical protein
MILCFVGFEGASFELLFFFDLLIVDILFSLLNNIKVLHQSFGLLAAQSFIFWRRKHLVSAGLKKLFLFQVPFIENFMIR